MIDCNDCVWKETCAAHQGGVIACPDGKTADQKLSPQEPPQDYRIFNRRQPDGSFRPLSDFFDFRS